MPPPSSGGVALIEMLNILEPYNLKDQGAAHARRPCTSRSKRCAARISIARAVLGDPDFVTVPIAELTSKAHARISRGDRSACDKASSSLELGKDIVTARAAGA